MMKLRTWILLLVIAVSTSSCINVIEELFLNKDGSGTYHLTIDMSDLISNPMFKSMMEQQDDSTSTSSGGLFGNEVDMMNADTSINFLAAAEKEGRTIDNPDFWKNVNINIKSDQEAGDMFTTIALDFKSLDDITYFYENLATVVPGDEGSDMFGPGGIAPRQLAFKLQNRTLSRTSSFTAPEQDMDDETEQMMKMFFAGATYKSIYHLPGKVKNADFAGADVDKKIVTVEVPLTEVMEGKAEIDGKITFKKR